MSEAESRTLPPGLRIAVTGASGMIGRALVEGLRGGGHHITRLVRRPEPPQTGTRLVFWDPRDGRIEPRDLEGHHVVIHLAGANIADGRWTQTRKDLIRTSRVQGTELLCGVLAGLKAPPQVLLSASAVGYYGDRPASEAVDESASPGTSFLAGVCHHWEQATRPAEQAGIRVVRLRFGQVLSTAGGALAKMLPIFRRGFGGRLGNGRQVVSWILLRELPDIVEHCIATGQLAGPVNVVTPKAASNAKLTKVLCETLARPERFPVPAFALKLRFGTELAQELLLSGAWVVPRRLLESGYKFRYPQLDLALRALLGG